MADHMLPQIISMLPSSQKSVPVIAICVMLDVMLEVIYMMWLYHCINRHDSMTPVIRYIYNMVVYQESLVLNVLLLGEGICDLHYYYSFFWKYWNSNTLKTSGFETKRWIWGNIPRKTIPLVGRLYHLDIGMEIYATYNSHITFFWIFLQLLFWACSLKAEWLLLRWLSNYLNELGWKDWRVGGT